ncbi:hypothetical protein [Streptomyces kronopolitis]|uniref:hypothetical protein n=1 Tax=Streptomyces kronopolitis TaxID=1612435 RepID=UPI0020BF573B|nr:hypothetical protein [Streptomyces kronopolitis]MCL6302831.1 hypothetical protein [Streptomyces kronopolitis]
MQMTEPFATTVAAVAPVIVLAGAVEGRPHFQWMKNDVEQYLAGTKPTWRSRPRFLFEAAMFCAWTLVLVLMVFAEYRSLRWLAVLPGKPQPDIAEKMLREVTFGMAMLIFMPIARYFWWLIPTSWRLLKMARAAAASEEEDDGDGTS